MKYTSLSLLHMYFCYVKIKMILTLCRTWLGDTFSPGEKRDRKQKIWQVWCVHMCIRPWLWWWRKGKNTHSTWKSPRITRTTLGLLRRWMYPWSRRHIFIQCLYSTSGINTWPNSGEDTGYIACISPLSICLEYLVQVPIPSPSMQTQETVRMAPMECLHPEQTWATTLAPGSEATAAAHLQAVREFRYEIYLNLYLSNKWGSEGNKMF